MTVLAASGRVWQRNWLVYKRLWHRILAFGFLQPVLFLTAMVIGVCAGVAIVVIGGLTGHVRVASTAEAAEDVAFLR